MSDHLDNVGTMLDRALNEWVAQIVVCRVFWTKTQAEPTPELCDGLSRERVLSSSRILVWVYSPLTFFFRASVSDADQLL